MAAMSVVYGPLGDQAVRARFSDAHGLPSLAVSRRIRAFCAELQKAEIPGVVEWIPGYATVAVVYWPLTIGYAELVAQLRRVERRMSVGKLRPADLVVIPALYGGEWGPDLADVARWCDMTEEDVVNVHTSKTYHVHMIGFAPGFPYLGVLPPELETARRPAPRLATPQGSVAIAGRQTGIYSIESPGGWNVIGRTPVPMYRADMDPPCLLAAGDEVRFEPITHEAYQEILRQVAAGQYRIRREIAGGRDED